MKTRRSHWEHGWSTATNAGVRSWIVRFQLEAGGRVIQETDTSQLFLMGDNGRPSYVDTTDSGGKVSRRMRLKILPGLVPPDSAIITVTTSYRGIPLTGSPVRLVLPVRPRQREHFGQAPLGGRTVRCTLAVKVIVRRRER